MHGALLLTIVCTAVLEGAVASGTQYCTDGEPDGVITNFVCPGPRFASLLSLAAGRALSVTHDLTRIVALWCASRR